MKAISLNQTKVVGGNVYQETYISVLILQKEKYFSPNQKKAHSNRAANKTN